MSIDYEALEWSTVKGSIAKGNMLYIFVFSLMYASLVPFSLPFLDSHNTTLQVLSCGYVVIYFIIS